MLTVIGQFERDGGRTTTLVVLDGGSRRGARSSVTAGRAVGHAVDDVQVGLFGGRNVEMSDGEGILIGAGTRAGRRAGTGTARERGARRAARAARAATRAT